MIGQQFAHYRIESLLGAGGMGEVFRAQDTRLGRNVAVKVLPEIFARDVERIARFEREAKLLASLNHNNIAALYGLEQSDGRHFLVMELVEGETLAERIQRGPIAAAEALSIAHQIAEAFETAHEKGIIHRDLKPANVKLTPEGKVKVLDFGLAKALEVTPQSADIMNSPTLLSAPTTPGIILGTAGYMSPEQAKGESADQRSDIFSFGCVLYEMLTGRQTFQANTVAETIAAVLMRDPDLNTLPANLNPKLEDLLRRCLAKNRRDRWHAMADVRVEIATISSDPNGLKLLREGTRRPAWKLALLFAAAMVAAIGITAAAVWNMRVPPPAGLTRFAFVLPEGQRLSNPSRQMVTISSDGGNIVYSAERQLYVRPMGQMESRPIQGTNSTATNPFFSPDGQWIGFYSLGDGKIKKVAITGGAAVNICDADNPFAASWHSSGDIFIGQGAKGIVRVSSSGGKPETVVRVQPGEQAHGPHLLPDGDSLIFTLAKAAGGIDRWDSSQILVQSLKSGKRQILIEGGSDARYLATGHIVYALQGNLLAVPFDLETLRVAGGPIPLVEGVMRSPGNTGTAQFDVAANGSIIYLAGATLPSRTFQLALVSRDGTRKPLNVPPGQFSFPRFSPDGKQLALNLFESGDQNISIYDLAGTSPLRRLTFGGGRNRSPIWTRDRQRIVFQSDREGADGLFWQRADGSESAERLVKADPGVQLQTVSWSPDGKTLFFDVRRNTGAGVAMFRPGIDSKPVQLIGPPAQNFSLSNDGRWLAYNSTESGESQIFVQPFPVTGSKYQVTTTGGQDPLWSPDGKQLFYKSGVGQIMAVDVQTQPTFTFGKTTPLPIENIGDPGPRSYDITPDGKTFVVLLDPATANSDKLPPEQINVTLHWLEELKQRVPQ